MKHVRAVYTLALCCGSPTVLAQNAGDTLGHPTRTWMRSTGGQAALLPQEELIAALPYDGSSEYGARGQEFEPRFDIYDIFLIEDIEPTRGARLGRFRSAGFGNDNPFGAEDVRVRIFENNGTGLPGGDGYTGTLVITSLAGEGFFNGDAFEWVTDFGQQCLPAGSYFIVFAVRMDFICCGGSNFFAQVGEPSVGGGGPSNAWFWNPGNGFGLGTHFRVRDPFSERLTGINYLLFGTPGRCGCSNPDCPADFDFDGDTDADDFFTYLDLFAAGDPCADIDNDADTDADDFFAYLDLFVQGC